MRPMRDWPSWWLRYILRKRWMAGYWADAWIELRERAHEDAIATSTDDESGPWSVSPPKGMH